MKDSEYLVVQKSLWETTADYYSLTDEASKLKDAMSKRDSIVSLLSNSKLEYINNSYSDLKNKNEKTLKMSKGKNYIILFIGLLLLSGLVYIFWYKQKKKKEIAGIRSYVESLINQHKESLNSVSIEEEEEGENEIQTQIKTKVQQDNLMTQETEMKISNHLKEFEKENLFLNGDISLSWLASYCKTNIKYLSHYIKVNKKKDFNNYINELRINYIIMKLINEPVYRKYKIATLAEETGFSSPNKFSTIFKQVTSSSPSTFISELIESDKIAAGDLD